MKRILVRALLGLALSVEGCASSDAAGTSADDLEASAEAELTSAEELADDEAWANGARQDEAEGDADMLSGVGHELVDVARTLGDCSFQYGVDNRGSRTAFFIEDGDDSVMVPGRMFSKKRAWGVKYRASLRQDPQDPSQKYVVIIKVRRDKAGKIRSVRGRGVYRGPGSSYSRDRAVCRR